MFAYAVVLTLFGAIYVILACVHRKFSNDIGIIQIEPIEKVEFSPYMDFKTYEDHYLGRDETRRTLEDSLKSLDATAKNVVYLAKCFNKNAKKN